MLQLLLFIVVSFLLTYLEILRGQALHGLAGGLRTCHLLILGKRTLRGRLASLLA
jgi:hypothetical protein